MRMASPGVDDAIEAEIAIERSGARGSAIAVATEIENDALDPDLDPIRVSAPDAIEEEEVEAVVDRGRAVAVEAVIETESVGSDATAVILRMAIDRMESRDPNAAVETPELTIPIRKTTRKSMSPRKRQRLPMRLQKRCRRSCWV